MEFLEAAKNFQELKKQLPSLFDKTSFAEALAEYLCRKDQILIEKPGPVATYSTSRGIDFKQICAFYHYGEVEIEIEIDFIEEYGDEPYGSIRVDCPTYTIARQYKFTILIDLFQDFTQEKFDNWVETFYETYKQKRINELRQTAQRLGLEDMLK